MNKNFKTIEVLCVCNNIGILGARVSLINSLGETVQQESTNHCGCATLCVCCEDNYRIRAQVPCVYSPKGQNFWAYIKFDNNYQRTFVFKKIYGEEDTGTLEIILSDTNYPEYVLDKGEITLWHGLK